MAEAPTSGSGWPPSAEARRRSARWIERRQTCPSPLNWSVAPARTTRRRSRRLPEVPAVRAAVKERRPRGRSRSRYDRIPVRTALSDANHRVDGAIRTTTARERRHPRRHVSRGRSAAAPGRTSPLRPPVAARYTLYPIQQRRGVQRNTTPNYPVLVSFPTQFRGLRGGAVVATRGRLESVPINTRGRRRSRTKSASPVRASSAARSRQKAGPGGATSDPGNRLDGARYRAEWRIRSRGSDGRSR